MQYTDLKALKITCQAEEEVILLAATIHGRLLGSKQRELSISLPLYNTIRNTPKIVVRFELITIIYLK